VREGAFARKGGVVELLMRLKGELDDPGRPCGVGVAEADALWERALEATRRDVGLPGDELWIYRDLLRASRDEWRLRLIATDDMPELPAKLRAAWARWGRAPGPYDPDEDDTACDPARAGYYACDWT
jgi:hypothetical protein